MRTCTTTRDDGCTCEHAHCTLCGWCLTCAPHPLHTLPLWGTGDVRNRRNR